VFEYSVEATVGAARAGTLSLPHGQVRTPAFMPVGTHAVVRGLHPAEIRRAGAQIILANTYHLHLRPGEAVIRAMGGLHQFTTWDGPMLTDSGGFQVFSLEGLRRIEEEGVEFTSHVDGSVRVLTPERATEIQWALGADVAMAFDHVVPGQAPHALAREGMERTLRWLERCKAAHQALTCGWAEGRDGGGAEGNDRWVDGQFCPAPPQALWPIIQGGTHPDLRHESLAGTLERGPWSGIAIGGLSVGEPRAETYRVLDGLEPELPRSVPRYLMGVGFPPDLLEGIARGIDLFDCVAATRNGRHGTAWLPTGRVNVRSAALRGSREPLDPECDCETCTTFPRGYLRHLFVVEDILGLRLIALHNVRFLVRLGEQARARILDGSFDRWSRDWLDRYSRPRGAS
jgi:queuine tRNA-ribosyltransferase